MLAVVTKVMCTVINIILIYLRKQNVPNVMPFLIRIYLAEYNIPNIALSHFGLIELFNHVRKKVKCFLVDVDECADGTNDCHEWADCTDTETGFTCECQSGKGEFELFIPWVNEN